jgi:glycosyltransferase involved in cell wall biosynthesis
MTLPYVSCICCTYNRAPEYQHLVEEGIESFLRQDYPADRRELIIHNDCPSQVLRPQVLRLGPGFIAVHEGDGSWTYEGVGKVRVYHSPRRIGSLGEKYNFAIQQARGDLVCPWEDDDISLPWRISQGVFFLTIGADHPGHPVMYDPKNGRFLLPDDCPVKRSYWKPPQVLYSEGNNRPVWKHNVGIRHHASIFTRKAWAAAGGYPACSGAQDAIFDGMLGGSQLPAFPQGIPPLEWAYLYRWGVSPVHLSGRTPHDAFYEEVGKMPVKAGTFVLKPHWRKDYVQLCREGLQ